MNRRLLKEAILNRYSNLGSTEAVDTFAKELGISRSSMYLILRHQMPREDVLVNMVKILDLDYNDLFRKDK